MTMEVPLRKATRHFMESSLMSKKPYMTERNTVSGRSMDDLRQPAPQSAPPIFVSVADEDGAAFQFSPTPRSDAAIRGHEK